MNEKGAGFVMLPAGWIRRGDLLQFKGTGLGVTVTALKLYIAILSATRTDSLSLGPGRARLSFDALEERAGIARGMIQPALGFLERWIEVERSRRGNVYGIVGWTKEPGQWVKLPSRHVLETRALVKLTSRSRVSLAALRMYLYLLERRQRGSTESRASYEKIRERTGVQQNDIPRAITALGAVDLVRCYSGRRGRDPEKTGENVYHILGLYGVKGRSEGKIPQSA